jgi:DNA-binding CsgD family transcriptional regulator
MSPQAGFLLQDQIIPRLISAVPNSVSFIGSEDAQELVQDGTLIAAQMIHNAERSGKKVVRNPGAGRRQGARKLRTISAGNVAFYTIQKLKCGRRSTGSSTVDVYGSGTQINGTTRLTSLDETVAGLDDVGEPLVLHDVLSNDQEDPATRAARKMDWDSVMASLSARDQAIINCLVEGKPLASLARRRHLNNSTLLYHKERLALKIQEYMGSDILIQIRRKPNWKDSLDASRERLACREERKHGIH